MNKDICSYVEITDPFPIRNLHDDYNKSFLLEFDNFYDSYKNGDLFF